MNTQFFNNGNATIENIDQGETQDVGETSKLSFENLDENLDENKNDISELRGEDIDDTINLSNDDTQLSLCNGFTTINDEEEKDKVDLESLLKSLGSLEFNDMPSLEDVIDDQDDQDQVLKTKTSENEENGRTGLSIGAAAHTVSTQWGETEIEEEERLGGSPNNKNLTQIKGVLTRSQSKPPIDPKVVVVDKSHKK